MQDRERYLELKRAASKRYRVKNAEKIKAYRESRKEINAEYHKQYYRDWETDRKSTRLNSSHRL